MLYILNVSFHNINFTNKYIFIAVENISHPLGLSQTVSSGFIVTQINFPAHVLGANH